MDTTTVKGAKAHCLDWARRVGGAISLPNASQIGLGFVEDCEKAFSDTRIRIVVCGEWNTGKSSLINALAGAELLPTAVEPCTSYITLLESGSEVRIEEYRSGEAERISAAQLQSLTATREHDESLEYLRIVQPGIWPDEDVLFVDTPGLEDLSKARSDVTLNYLPSADVIVLVLDAIQGVKGTQKKFIAGHLAKHELLKVVVVVNLIDTLNSSDDVKRKLLACKAALRDSLPDAAILPTSSKMALDALRSGDAILAHRAGVNELAVEIRRIVARDRSFILARRFERATRNRMDDILARLAAEESTLLLPVAEAEQRVETFRRHLTEATIENDKAFDAAGIHVREKLDHWLEAVRPQVNELVQGLESEVDHLEGLDAVRSFVKGDAIGRALSLTLKELSADLDRTLRDGLETACREILTKRVVLPRLVVLPGLTTADIESLVPEVSGIFQHVPQFVVQLVDVLLLDRVVSGGLLPPLLDRLGFGKLLKGVEFFSGTLLPDLVRSELARSVSRALVDLPERVSEAMREAALHADEAAIQTIRDALDRRLRDVEAGYEAAAEQLLRSKAMAESRRMALASSRRGLEGLRSQLKSLAA